MPSRRAFLAAAAASFLAGCSADPASPTPTPRLPSTSARSPSPATVTTASPTQASVPGSVGLRTLAAGLGPPTALAEDTDAGRFYVAEQPGRIRVIEDGSLRDAPVLDVSDRIVAGGERGLLGLALHPSFAENRRLYVRYSAPPRPGTPSGYSHTFVLAEFTARDDGVGVRSGSERTVIEIPQPQGNHNSGSIAFGPDGFLYVGVGDGGAGGDTGSGHVDDWYEAIPGGNGQDVEANLLGSVLRLDVDARDGDRAYGIPDDNPLVGRSGLDEHYAWGLRNPWGMGFDGDRLVVADVGQNRFEEVNVVERGGNYGWNVREGRACYRAESCPASTPDGDPLIEPVIAYPHGGAAVSGNAVIGGYVYRGDAIPGLRGEYVFGDLGAGGRLFRATAGADDERWPVGGLDVAPGDRGKLRRLIATGRDRAGEVYALSMGADGGGVHRLVPTG